MKTDTTKKDTNDKRPYITVVISEKNISSLHDSGATASVCNTFGADILISMGFKKLKGQKTSGTMADEWSHSDIKRLFLSSSPF